MGALEFKWSYRVIRNNVTENMNCIGLTDKVD
jgi:hypothetical protein